MNEEGPIDFPQHAVSNKELRDASVAAAKKLNAFNVRMNSNVGKIVKCFKIIDISLKCIFFLVFQNIFQVELAMRKDIFDILTAFSANAELMKQLSYEQKRFVEKVKLER